jgi:hypothetical protein
LVGLRLSYHTSTYSDGFYRGGVPFDTDNIGNGEVCLVFYHWSANDNSKAIKRFVAEYPLIEASTLNSETNAPKGKRKGGDEEVFEELHTDSEEEESFVPDEAEEEEEVKKQKKPTEKKKPAKKNKRVKRDEEEGEEKKQKKEPRPTIPRKEPSDTNGKLIFTKNKEESKVMKQTTIPLVNKAKDSPIDFTDKKRKHYGVWFDEASLAKDQDMRLEIDMAINDLVSDLDMSLSSPTRIRHAYNTYDMYKNEDACTITAIMISPPATKDGDHSNCSSMIITSNRSQDFFAIEHFCKNVPHKSSNGWGILRSPQAKQ